jgi:hypothetical protein
MSLFLIGALGLAVDGGQLYAQRQMAQAAADAATQAGIMSMFNGTNTNSPAFGTGTAPAPSACTTTDLRTPCVYARYNGFGGTSSDTVMLSYPATVSGVTLSSVSVPAIRVTVQRTVQTSFIRFVGGPASSTITANSISGLVGAVSANCIYVLDPSASGAFTANNGANVAVNGCNIAVSSSSSSAAILSATVTAPAMDMVTGAGCNCSQTYPTIVTVPPPIADPFLSLPALTPGACLKGTSTYYPPSNATLAPGTYCGGITVTNGVTGVTFGAGTYIMKGGGVTFSSGTTTGSNVMFYLTGTNSTYGSVSINNGASVTLSAPSSGTYLGILFFQDRSITSSNSATFAGGANMQLTGSLYFPTTTVSFSNGSSLAAYSTAIVADKVSFVGGASIKYDPTGLKTGLFTKSVVLVQ